MTNKSFVIVSTPVGGQTLKGGLYFSDTLANDAANRTRTAYTSTVTCVDSNHVWIYLTTPCFYYGGVLYIAINAVITSTAGASNGTQTFKVSSQTEVIARLTHCEADYTVTVTWKSVGTIASLECPCCGDKGHWGIDGVLDKTDGDLIVCLSCGWTDVNRELVEA